MLAIAGYTLAVAALFALFALAFAYTVEDRFIDRGLHQEAERLRAERDRSGAWPGASPGMRLHASQAELPSEIAGQLAREPERREFAAADGRHYHLQALGPQGPWLLAEVSSQLIVRPMRTELLQWLGAWGLAVVLLALGLGWALARRLSQPISLLALAAATAQPSTLPAALPGAGRDDEIGELARRLGELHQRTRDYIAREQAFSRDASHELRTPLAVLRLGLERLAAQGQAVAPLLASLQLMEQTVATLLQLARESAVPASSAPTPLLALVETWVLAHAELLDARGQQLDCRLTRHDALPLPAPVLRLAITSLLANALAHGEAGGRIELSLIDGALQIRNPGVGDQPGDGLGLTLVQRLLERHGGRLRFRQHQGHSEALIDAGHTADHGR